jgi:hypothetical protein
LKQSFDYSARSTAPTIAQSSHSGARLLRTQHRRPSIYSGAHQSQIHHINYVFFIGHAGKVPRGYINYFWPRDYFNYVRHIDYF